MLLSEAITMTLRRTGLNTSNTSNKDQARLYLNAIANRIVSRARWWFLYKTDTITTTLTNTSVGTFTSDLTTDFITLTAHGLSDTNAIVVDSSGTLPAGLAASTTYYVRDKTDDTFKLSASSGGTAIDITNNGTGTHTAYTQPGTRTYALAADVLTPHSFVDETNGNLLPFKGWDYLSAVDPERDETGDVDTITVEGIDSSGLTVVAVYPKHSTASETIRYHYYAYIPDWSSGNDNDNLDQYLPQIMQPALFYGAAELYCQEKGDSEASGENRGEYEGVIDSGLNQNLRMWGNRKFRRMGDEVDSSGGFDFHVKEGSLSA